MQRRTAAARDRGASGGPGGQARAKRLRRDGWRFSEDSRTAVPTRDRHELSGMAAKLRLTEGLAALSEGETPARVAAAVGYSSGPAFGAAFRSVFGITPGRSRRGAENTRAENQIDALAASADVRPFQLGGAAIAKAAVSPRPISSALDARRHRTHAAPGGAERHSRAGCVRPLLATAPRDIPGAASYQAPA